MRKRRSPKWLLIFCIWMLPGLYFAIQIYFQRAFNNQPITLRSAFIQAFVFWILWAISTPLILWLARTFPIPRRQWLDGLLFHLPAGFIFSLTHLLVYVFIISWIINGGPPNSFEEFLGEFQLVFISSFAWWSLVYWTALIASYAFDYYQRYREGAIKASQLEAQLAQAQLQALKMQLHPHFLFNTLHSISALIREDVEVADQMIARLGDFLRMTLQNSGVQETTLKQELDFLRCYLDIQQLRFQDRLTTQIEVEEAALEASVPNLFLQPIVENAIRHGIASQTANGLIAIYAHRHEGHLQVLIQDNGPGLQSNINGKDGVGLANTRARLEQLYGENYRFEIANSVKGGVVVTLEIPFSVYSF